MLHWLRRFSDGLLSGDDTRAIRDALVVVGIDGERYGRLEGDILVSLDDTARLRREFNTIAAQDYAQWLGRTDVPAAGLA